MDNNLTCKRVLKRLIHPKIIDQYFIQQYFWNGRIPWSPGYVKYRERFVSSLISDEVILDVFRNKGSLPQGFGIGIDERCIEYPWLFANFPVEGQCILDAGSILNFKYILDCRYLKEKRIHILTLAPENNCYWDRGISYIYDDLRYIPIRNDYYDAVFCISVLEHVGLDNTSFAGDSIFNEHNKYDAELVMKELRRVLKPGGALLITVPFGIYQDYGTFQQFDAELLWKAINAFGVAKNTTLTFYKYSSLGWQISTEMDCKTCKYVENTANAWRDHRPVSMIAETDRAAAARAVACLRLTKA